MLVRYELVVLDTYGAKAECLNLTNDHSIYVSNKQAWLCQTLDTLVNKHYIVREHTYYNNSLNQPHQFRLVYVLEAALYFYNHFRINRL